MNSLAVITDQLAHEEHKILCGKKFDDFGINEGTLKRSDLPPLLYHYELEYPALIDSASTGMPVEKFSLF
jgi:hypothetical protein